jgi:hypothetical protein
MYCSSCASPVTAGLKFCNRCGASFGKDRADTQATSVIQALITAIVLVPILGLGAMLGGAIALKQGVELPTDIVGFFMLFAFLIIGVTEISLLRHLSRTLGTSQRIERSEPAPPLFQPAPIGVRELNAVRDTAEPLGSVTENTTRTLEHSLRNVSR